MCPCHTTGGFHNLSNMLNKQMVTNRTLNTDSKNSKAVRFYILKAA